MDRILPNILATFTGTRVPVERINWNDQIIIPNLFRVWEIVFWQRAEIKPQQATVFVNDENTGEILSVQYHLFSVEAKLSYVERILRRYLQETTNSVWNTLKYWEWKIAHMMPQFDSLFGAFQPQFAFDGFYIAPAIDDKPSAYVFAIAYDSLPQDQLSSSTPTVDIGSSSNRLLLCGTQGANGSDSVTAVTWNTTEVMAKQIAQQTSTNRFQTIWSLTPVGTGSHGAVIAGTLDIETFIVYSGVSQTSQPHNAINGSGSGATSSSLSITTAGSTDWIFGSFANNTAAQTVVAGTTKRSGGSNSVNQANDSNGAGSPTSLGYTWSGSGSWGAVGVSFSPVGAAGPANVKTWDGVTQSSGIKTYVSVAVASVKTVIGVN